MVAHPMGAVVAPVEDAIRRGVGVPLVGGGHHAAWAHGPSSAAWKARQVAALQREGPRPGSTPDDGGNA